ncbi:uncharacterized protein LOC127854993 [Dreissena polymorpha]|uniref:B box-type domain-containing protein n=1 Tax=Dreissena polymorpha TaxID=45954 RepID=A0A9D4HHI4_DREPO|nr:uncharacterized protein LOC127854993 [Dreissena polymorpha]KAH3719300.1 hypothetical protein DPMN_062131 [Dreissena polymorpha]
MATFSQLTVDKGSDSVIDFCCSPCLEHKTVQWAEFYCDNCLKFYCAKCINLHGQLFGKHVTYGRGETSKWPVSKEVEDVIRKCDLHEDKLLEMFCDKHSQLCCTNCVRRNHRKCAKVTLMSESVKGPPPDLQQLSRRIKTILVELQTLQIKLDTNMKSLDASYNKQVLEICETRQKINAILDNMEKATIKDLDDKMKILKAALKTDSDKCSKLKHELTCLSDAIHDIINKSEFELILIASNKCMERIKQSQTLKENSVQVDSSLTFQADRDLQEYLSKLSSLGNVSYPGQVFAVQGLSMYNMSIQSDRGICGIAGICALSSDQILVANNERVKLLDHEYQVVGHCDLSAYAKDMCVITPSEVAVAVNNYQNKDKTGGVQFVFVNDGQLIKGKILLFQHSCNGIAHSHKDLYVTSGTALYKYSMSGYPLKKLYEDTSGDRTVHKCAVSPSGDKIFITNPSQDKVLTLARDGSVLHTLTDPDLRALQGIHATDLGLVLVCGKNIIQLDGEGRKKLATLITTGAEYDRVNPLLVFYNKSTATIIVGLSSCDILVLPVK